MTISISGFTFVHNAIEGGYPFVEVIMALQPFVQEIVVVDAASTDGTRQVLERMCQRLGSQLRILDDEWGDQAGQTLARLHARHIECRGDIVIHAEGDEVYDGMLLGEVKRRILAGQHDLAVHRLQVSQNFQRCRWYPWPVHRVFPRGTVRKVGETTDRKDDAVVIGPEHGYLWDCTNCFRDNWVGRVQNQAALWHGVASFKAVPLHFNEGIEITDVGTFLNQAHWFWKRSPFDLPGPLARLVGKARYEPGV